MTLYDSIEKYTADVTRIGLADAGDSLDDANFEEKAANATILKVFALLEWITETLQELPTLRSGMLPWLPCMFIFVCLSAPAC